MQGFRTHYDNLKVAQDAPIEVIQAAYRTLARKHHPDQTGNTPESDAIMKSINASYEVLSDPAARARHDAWIASQSRNPSGLPGSRRPLSITTFIAAACYAVTALSLIRLPGLRILGIGMLVAGLIFFMLRSTKGSTRGVKD